ncbi:MAG TPA: hypothetical protein VL944_01330 [Candidatus Acidoferrum sp.]|nr:hypothetical protein [Candidatus Acidoferrum sp.]
MAGRKNAKYSKELEQIKMLKSINSVLKTSDMENALLANSAKDSETVSDGMVEEMLGTVRAQRDRNRGVQDIERFTTQVASTAPQRRAQHPKPSRRAMPARRARPKMKRSAKRMAHGKAKRTAHKRRNK